MTCHSLNDVALHVRIGAQDYHKRRSQCLRHFPPSTSKAYWRAHRLRRAPNSANERSPWPESPNPSGFLDQVNPPPPSSPLLRMLMIPHDRSSSFIYSFLISFPSSWCPTFSNPVVTVRSISPSRELPTYLVLLRLRHSLVHVVSRSSSVHLSFLTPHLRTRVVRELECRPGYHIRVAYFSFCNRQPCPSRCSLF